TVKNAKNETTYYGYNLNGQMIWQTDGRLNTWYIEYNPAGKVKKRIDPGGRTGQPGSYVYAAGKNESYTYKPDGSLKQKTDRNGGITQYIYYSNGRLQTQTTTLGTSSAAITYTYDGNGNTLTVSQTLDGATADTVTRTYDELNRATSKEVTGISGKAYYEYDVTATSGITIDEGCTAETDKDPVSNSGGHSATKIYDKAGRLKTVYDGISKIASYDYYDNGNLMDVVYTSGAREDYTYYRNNLLWTLVNKNKNGSVIDTYSYMYDEANNLTTKSDGKGNTIYTYDELNRLYTVTEPTGGSKTTYTYDASGNRTGEKIEQGGGTSNATYSYDDSNRLTGISTVNGSVTTTTTYTPDSNGNVISVSVKTQGTTTITTNTYDVLNRLVKVTTGNTTVAINTYDGEGKRNSKTANGAVTRYFYEYDKVVLETDSAGVQTARNIYGTNLLARFVGSDTYYYMYNGHADVTALVDTNGVKRATYYYDAFGNVKEEQYYDASGKVQSAPLNNNIGYAGYQYDKETGMYYLNSRMYDPKIARFLQEDTYLGDPNDPLSLNLYTYCHNEPLMYDDPTGHIEINGRNFTPEDIGRHEYLLSKQDEDSVIRLHDVLKSYNTSLSEYNYKTSAKLDEIFHTNIWSPNYDLNRMGQYNNELLYNTLVLQDENLFNDLGETISNYGILSSFDIDRINRKINSNPAYKSIIETVENERDEQQIKMARTAGSIQVDLIPVAGNAKSVLELVTGKDYITGEEVGTPSRVMAAVGIILPLAKKVKYLPKFGKVIKGLWEADEVGKDVSKVSKVVSEGTNEVARTEDDFVTLYRGVNESHVDFANSSKGIVTPNRRWWQVWKPKSTPLEHNAGYKGTLNSPYTSWTTNPDVAENFALRNGVNGGGSTKGVVLEVQVPRSKILESPNTFKVKLIQNRNEVSESEVFLKGKIVTPNVKEVMWP
ncbi:MAG TPA: RHS repeat-associated core domain-containing protein, partial [Clostridia bacterium]